MSSGGQTVLPFDVTGSDILLFDDVLYTGRTIRAVVNELFDYGRPQRVQLAVLGGQRRARTTHPCRICRCQTRFACQPIVGFGAQ